MYALDFEYDGRFLSDFGFIICNFDSASGAQTASPGANISFSTVSRHSGKVHSLTGTTYDECIQSTFHICKNPDVNDDMVILDEEFRDLIRWLNRHDFLKFRVLYDYEDDATRIKCYFNASFNVSKITIADVLYGLELTMYTNAPFGFGDPYLFHKELVSENESIIFFDMSDEIGLSYLDMSITCKQSGDLIIKNSAIGYKSIIKNCSSGEKITINGNALIISTSLETHTISKDFNFVFPQIVNTYWDRTNIMTFSLPCDITIVHTPIIKNIP